MSCLFPFLYTLEICCLQENILWRSFCYKLQINSFKFKTFFKKFDFSLLLFCIYFVHVIFVNVKASINLTLHLPWCFIVFTIVMHFQCQNIWEGLFSFLVIFLSCDLFNGEFPCDFLLIIRQTCSTLWYFYNHYFFAFKCIPTSCKIWKKLIVIPISLFFHNIGPNSSQILPQKPHPTHFAFFGSPKWNMLGYSIKY